MTSRLFAITAGLAIAFAVLTTTALAAVPLQEGYDPQGVPPTDVAAGHGGGTLPFTGLDLVLVLVGGLVLVGLGLTVRRLARHT
jgi:hypothetical protein